LSTKRKALSGVGEGMRCGQTAVHLKTAIDSQRRLGAFATNVVALLKIGVNFFP